MDFHGQRAIITGAAGSIGWDIAAALSRHGARVLATDRDEDKLKDLVAQADEHISWRRADVREQSQVRGVVRDACEELGGADILVNVAGIVGQSPYNEISTEEWDRMFEINVRGTFYFIQEVGPLMCRQNHGKIVNFSSKSGKTGSALMVHYSSAKAAIIGLTQALAHELAPHKVNVNAVCPGITADTGVWSQVSSRYVTNLGLSRDEVVQKFTGKVPLGRLAEVEDLTGVVLFLCSSWSDYMTGQAINISGGREMH